MTTTAGRISVASATAPATGDSRRRYRNFDTLRLLAAAAVLLTHAYYVVDGHQLVEPFAKLYGSRFELGEIGVYVFFVISGFLITGSFARRRSTSAYLVKRVLRIFPALIVCAAICAFVLGAVFTTLPLHRYFDSHGPVHYFLFTSILCVLPTGDFPQSASAMAAPARSSTAPSGRSGRSSAATWQWQPWA